MLLDIDLVSIIKAILDNRNFKADVGLHYVQHDTVAIDISKNHGTSLQSLIVHYHRSTHKLSCHLQMLSLNDPDFCDKFFEYVSRQLKPGTAVDHITRVTDGKWFA